MSKRVPGSVYVGRCLGSCEPHLWFYYVLLSHDKNYWTTAKFMKGHFGAQVENFTDHELDQLGYVGHIASVLLHSIGVDVDV
ncbi:hypothetical protein LCGC14_1270760 [marine sediment metagenome]|uniref:Uncharacterized protein n=1 Tax=marine sediment metagenome TaxID=412755 RepID=A0A0F9KZX2_9ZZZZ